VQAKKSSKNIYQIFAPSTGKLDKRLLIRRMAQYEKCYRFRQLRKIHSAVPKQPSGLTPH
jgi:hypothetical protein